MNYTCASSCLHRALYRAIEHMCSLRTKLECARLWNPKTRPRFPRPRPTYVYWLLATGIALFVGVYVWADGVETTNPSLFQGNATREQLFCRNITSSSNGGATPFEETNFDLPCRIRGACEKMFLFVICPPFSGSTAIYSLLGTSTNAATLLEARTWAGEGQWLYFKRDKGKESTRWADEDGFFNATLYSEVLMEAWDKKGGNATVFVEKSPSNIVRAHKLYNEFRKRGRVRFLLMLQSPCYSKAEMKEYLEQIEYSQVLLAQFKEITLFIRYEELLLNLESEIDRIKTAFPELSDIDPSKPPPGDFGKRSTPLSEYIERTVTGTPPHLVPRRKDIEVDRLSYSMLMELGLV